MKTSHTITSLLVAAALAVAMPAFGQSKAATEHARLKALEASSHLRSLEHLSELRELSRELGKLGDLRSLRSLEALAGLEGLAVLAELDLAAELAGPRLAVGKGQVARHAGTAGPEQTERFTRTFRVGPGGSLDLANIAGDIVVKAGAGDEMVIDAIKRTPQRADAGKQLAAVNIEVVERGGRVEVKTRYPENSRNLRVSVDFTLTLPAGASATVRSVSGNVKATGTRGALRLASVSGDVTVDLAEQVEELKTVSGDVTLTASSGLVVHLSTVSGEVVVRDVKAQALESSSISGEVRMTEVTADRASASTIDGGIEYVGPFAPKGRYEFKAHAGDVLVVPTSNTGFEVDAQTFSGGIRCDLPLSSKTGNVPERHMRRELKGIVGDGSAIVAVKTFSGDVVIRKR